MLKVLSKVSRECCIAIVSNIRKSQNQKPSNPDGKQPLVARLTKAILQDPEMQALMLEELRCVPEATETESLGVDVFSMET